MSKIQLNFLGADIALTKRFRADGTKDSYPMVKNFTSYTEPVSSDALCTSKLIASAMWTAYSSVFSRWASDNEVFGDKGMLPVDLMELLQSQKACGLDIMNASAGDGEDTQLTLEERLEFAKSFAEEFSCGL